MAFDTEFLISALRSSTDALLIVDTQCTVLFVNDAYLSLFHERREDIVGKDWRECKKDSNIERVLRTGKPMVDVNCQNSREARNWYNRYDGMGLYVSIYPVHVRGGVAGAVASYRELKEVRRRLRSIESQLSQYGNELRSQYRAAYQLEDIVGESDALELAKRKILRVAPGSAPVLLRGESGTGKELFAQSIHNLSSRSREAFVAINCPSLSETLAESELFGYEEGAFSGALKGGKLGLLKIADGGTLFLDEIGDLSLNLQAKVLRVLETGEFYRVGGVKPVKVNLRLVSATNRNLEQMVREGTFREDLYFRLCVITVDIPPLRERGEDVLRIADSFVGGQENSSYKISSRTRNYLLRYDWPGNVRELKNALITMMNFSQDSLLEPEHLPQYIETKCRQIAADALHPQTKDREAAPSAEKDGEMFPHLTGRKRRQALYLYELLEKYGYTVEGKRQSAQEAGICLATLYNRIKEYGID